MTNLGEIAIRYLKASSFTSLILYRWHIQNLCSTPDNSSYMAGSNPCVCTSELVFILKK